MIYVMGSLRNAQVPVIGNALRAAGHGVFDDWFAAGPEADDKWQEYEKARGRTYAEALDGLAAHHVFSWDRTWLSVCDVGVLVLPAGASAHLELGWMIGRDKRGFILMDGEPERYDVMRKFATVVFSVDELIERLK